MRSYLLLIMILCTVSIAAQSQKGYVKTLGRPNQKGTALSGVAVRVKGGHNAVLSGKNGTFAVPMSGKKNGDAYSLQQVQKQGYELNEQGIIGRQYAFSDKVPLTIVMVSTRQLQADKQRIENNAYQLAEKNYKTRLALLEKQKESSTITTDQYRLQLQDLQNKYDKYLSLIDDLADHYAHVDYDDLNAKEQEINHCIENGDLEHADSLLQQMGIQQRAEDIVRRLAAGQQLMDEALQEKEAVLKQQEKDAEYLYLLYTISLSKYDFNQAERYLSTRAEIDTMNVEWNYDYTMYAIQQRKYDTAKNNCYRLIRIYDSRPEENNMHLVGKSVAYNALGNIFTNTNEKDESVKYFIKAINLQRQLFNQYPYIITSYARTIGNLSNILIQDGQLDKSRDFLFQAKAIFEDMVKIDSVRFRMDYVKVLFALGKTYILSPHHSDLEDGIMILLKALGILLDVDEQTQENMQMKGKIILDLSYAYSITSNESSKAEKCFDEAIKIFSELYTQNPDANVRELFHTLVIYGQYFYNQSKVDRAKDCYEQAIKIISPYASRNPTIYTELSHALNGLGIIYMEQRNLNKSRDLFEKALNVRRSQQSATYNSEISLSVTLLNLGVIYINTGEFQKAENVLKEAVSMDRRLYKDKNEIELAKALCYLGMLYIQDQSGRNSESETVLTEALYICEDSYDEEKTETKMIYLNILQNLGHISSINKNYSKAYIAFSKLIPMIKGNKTLLSQNNPNFNTSLYGILMSSSYDAIMLKKYSEAEQYAQEGFNVVPSQHIILTNLAAALLFQGKYTEAENIYRQYKSELKDSFLDDFKQFSEAGVIPQEYEKDVEKIKRMLDE